MRSTPLTHAGPPTPVTVFLIGMTIRKPWRVDAWGSTAHAMTRMITELRANRAAVVAGEDVHDLGFLHAEMGVFARGPAVVQYWASPKHLYAYARDEAREHLPAHKEFYARVRHEAVGIWHETYAVPADGIETFYRNSGERGLARAFGAQPLNGALRRQARDRHAAQAVQRPVRFRRVP